MVLRPALQSSQSLLCSLHSSKDQEGGGPNDQVVSIKRATHGRWQKSWKIIHEERKEQGQQRILAEN